jgi:glycosyltransferase involved in cell wall biosynthesis
VLIGNINQKNQGAEFSKLSTVFCLSEKVKSELMDHYAVDGATINMVYGGSSIDFLPLNENEKSAVKESHTDGKEYFLYRGAFHSSNIIQLLKAFSIFKKRQKSTMKMVLLGSIKPGDKEFPVLINTYKYRDDIIVVNGEDEHTEKELTGAAYAYVQPYRSNSLCFVFDAMQNNIPSLIDASSPLIEIDSEAALCFDTHSAEDIADVLMRIYKDERLYGDVVAKGQELIAKDYKGETLNRIWNSLFQVKED